MWTAGMSSPPPVRASATRSPPRPRRLYTPPARATSSLTTHARWRAGLPSHTLPKDGRGFDEEEDLFGDNESCLDDDDDDDDDDEDDGKLQILPVLVDSWYIASRPKYRLADVALTWHARLADQRLG